MTESIQEAYVASLAGEAYDTPAEVGYDFESVNQRLWDEKERAGLGSRAEFEAARDAKREAERPGKEKLAGGKVKAKR